MQCDNGRLQSVSSSKIAGLQINGVEQVPLNAGSIQNLTFPVGSDGSYVTINKTDTSVAGVLIQDAAFVHVVNVGDFVIGQAKVTGTTANCPAAGSGGSSSSVSNVQPCPTGSAYNPATLRCEIPGGTRSNSSSAVGVGAPFDAGSGATVMTLAQATKLYPSNPCVKGQGPNYVLVGTNGADRINGTRNADRIIGLGGNDRIAGQGGSDCVSDGNGKDLIYVGNGNARVTVGNGNDRISARNGNISVTAGNGKDAIYAGNGNVTVKAGKGGDTVSVGNGNDKITLGNGKSTVHTGNGNSAVKVGNGTVKIRVGAGQSKVTAHGKKAEVSCTSKSSRAYVLKTAASFAAKHGCSVTTIKK